MQIKLPQLIPQEICLKCKVCCRYTEPWSIWAAFVLKEEKGNRCYWSVSPEFIQSYGFRIKPRKQKERYICPFFINQTNSCDIYASRPFDCQLYPFVITYSPDYSKIILAADKQCPFIADGENTPLINKHIMLIKDILENEDFAAIVYQNKGIFMPFMENLDSLYSLEKISHKVFGSHFGLKAVSLKDKEIFRHFFLLKTEKIFSHVFEYIYGWTDISHILWTIVDENLLVFWNQGGDLFLLLPPLGKDISFEAIDYSRKICSRGIHSPLIVENVTEEDIGFFHKAGFRIKKSGQEYIYRTTALAGLGGERFKSQRWACNYFQKKNAPAIRNFVSEDAEKCLDLYMLWAKERLKKNQDNYFRLLIEDGFFSHSRLMRDFRQLGLRGKVLEVNDRIAGYSFGYPFDKGNFCIFAEVTKPGIKGGAQYLFREFCRDLTEFSYINSMDDSGLDNLKKTKMLYHPAKINPIYSCIEPDKKQAG
jgi:Fe-S-cluster containining protein